MYIHSYHRRNGKRVDGYNRRGNKAYHKIYPSAKEREHIIHQYQNKSVSNVKITGSKISLNYDGHRLVNPYRRDGDRDDIASWSHTPYSKILVYDKDIKPERLPGILVHESVEQYLVKEKGLTYNQAHNIALVTEKKYVTNKLNQNWQGYQNSVLNAN